MMSVLLLIVGFLSSLFGVGGGASMVPVMIVWFGFPAKIAAATECLLYYFQQLLEQVLI
nr:TSUP family transporter [Shouchella patagoniensis]